MPSCTGVVNAGPVLGLSLGSLASSPAQAALIQVGFLLRTVLSTEVAGPAAAPGYSKMQPAPCWERPLPSRAGIQLLCPVGSGCLDLV